MWSANYTLSLGKRSRLRTHFFKGERGGLFAAEEAHHLADIEEPVDEEEKVQDDVGDGTEFDVLTCEHGGEIQMGCALVKESIVAQGGVLRCGGPLQSSLDG